MHLRMGDLKTFLGFRPPKTGITSEGQTFVMDIVLKVERFKLMFWYCAIKSNIRTEEALKAALTFPLLVLLT